MDLHDFGEYYHGADCLGLGSRLRRVVILHFVVLQQFCRHQYVFVLVRYDQSAPGHHSEAPLSVWRNADKGPMGAYRIICPRDLGKYPSCSLLKPMAPSVININPQHWIFSHFTAPCPGSQRAVPPLLSSAGPGPASLLEQPWVLSAFPWTNSRPSARFCPL